MGFSYKRALQSLTSIWVSFLRDGRSTCFCYNQFMARRMTKSRETSGPSVSCSAGVMCGLSEHPKKPLTLEYQSDFIFHSNEFSSHNFSVPMLLPFCFYASNPLALVPPDPKRVGHEERSCDDRSSPDQLRLTSALGPSGPFATPDLCFPAHMSLLSPNHLQIFPNASLLL